MQPNIKACGSFQLPYCMIGWFWLELVCCASRWWWAGRLPYWWLWWFLLNGWWHDGRLIWHPKSLGWTFRHSFDADDAMAHPTKDESCPTVTRTICSSQPSDGFMADDASPDGPAPTVARTTVARTTVVRTTVSLLRMIILQTNCHSPFPQAIVLTCCSFSCPSPLFRWYC